MAQPEHHRTGALATGGRPLRSGVGASARALSDSDEAGNRASARQWRTGEAVREIAPRIARAAGDDFLAALATGLGDVLGAAHVLVAECDARRRDRVRVLAMASHGRPAAEAAARRLGAAGGVVLERGSLTVPDRARAVLPDDAFLHALAAESFCARRVDDANGIPLGLMAVVHSEPLADSALTEALLAEFAPRVAAELGRRRSDSALRESERRLRSLVANAPLAVLEIDRGGRVTSANAEGARIAGLERPAALVGENIVDLAAPWDRARVRHFVEQAVEGRVCRFEYSSVIGEEARIHDATLIPSPDLGASVVKLLGYVQDITARKHSEQKLLYRAEHDSLTGLPNHRLFMDRLRSGIARAKRNKQPLALLFIDLNQFKPVNDEFGHQMGDRVLRGVAERLRATVREVDTVARIGGDEFAVILEAVSGEGDAARVAAKIGQTISQPFSVRGHTVRVDASAGVAIYPEHGEVPSALLHHADSEMYRAKRSRTPLREPQDNPRKSRSTHVST